MGDRGCPRSQARRGSTRNPLNYHKKEDLITIPPYIASLVPHGTYSYHLRIHNNNLMELVFYAIPKT